jgi:alpha,alpha-trehalase
MKPSAQLGPQFTQDRLRPALEYIDRYWDRLEKFKPHDDGTLVGMPRPYFVPSASTGTGFAFEEIYYWDTFFTAQGFIGTSREYLMKGLLEDLMSMMERFHIIPNSGRMYHTSRSQPPFLTTFIMQIYRLEGSKRWLRDAMDVAKEEYRTVWMGVAQPNWRQVFNGLSRYYDTNVLDDLAEAESGWDMTTRFDRQALSYLPVDLNALLYKYEKDFQEAATILGDDEEAGEWAKRAAKRKLMMKRYLWNEDKGFWFDYNFMTGKHSQVWSLAGFFPMWAGLDDDATAAKVMSNLDKFEFAGGLATTAAKPHIKMKLPTQWAYPNGWAPLHLVAIEAMERYGYRAQAERVARKWLNANLTRFEEHGEFIEKYNVVNIHAEPADGLYPGQVGFGWTNAVFVRLCKTMLTADELPAITSVHARNSLRTVLRDPKNGLRRVGAQFNRFNLS